MKTVVFFHCEYKQVARLVELFAGKYRFVVIHDPTVKSAHRYPKESTEFEIIWIEFLKKGIQRIDALANELAKADFVIVHKELINPFLARYYDDLSPQAKNHLPSQQALFSASDKRFMRKAFDAQAPQITPFHHSLKLAPSSITKDLQAINVSYPIIIKPANNMSSLFVERINNEHELLTKGVDICEKILSFYTDRSRIEEPTIVVEEYLDGQMYTVESWVNADGKYVHTPIIRVLTAEDIGLEGFHLFCRYTVEEPEKLQQAANDVVEKATNALGVRNASLHTELVLTKDGFKIIEIGARVGGHRQWMLSVSYGIDCYKNDFLIRTNQAVHVTNNLKTHSAAVHLFAPRAGNIIAMQGINDLIALQSYDNHDFRKSLPFFSQGAHLGGVRALEIQLKNDKHEQLLQDVAKLHELVYFEYDDGSKLNHHIVMPDN